MEEVYKIKFNKEKAWMQAYENKICVFKTAEPYFICLF